MESTMEKPIKVAILDLYQGVANEGMRCIREMLYDFKSTIDQELICEEFDVRTNNSIPSLEYDIYISSGGPGSPLESEGTTWEKAYFQLIEQLVEWNKDDKKTKKHVFFICHSFQLACRFFEVGQVIKRKSTAFGVFPLHHLDNEKEEKVFRGLNNPFYCVDSRDYQVLQTNISKLHQMQGELLCLEKERPHVPLERAAMAIRFNPYMIGTQFHPEADAKGMSMYLLREDKKQMVIDNHGEAKWASMIEQLNDPDKIEMTNSHILPNFMKLAVADILQNKDI